MCRIKLFGLAVVTLGLMILSLGQAFAQDKLDDIPEALPSESSAGPKVRPLTVSTGLVDDTVITGTLIDSTELSIKTAFGQASIPLSEVAGIRFPTADDRGTTVVMLNGDSITGATDLKYANVETSWGSAKINGQNISTMLFVPGLRWESVQALGGKRWNLVEATAPSNVSAGNIPAGNPSGVQPASGTRSRTIPGQTLNSSRPQVIFGR